VKTARVKTARVKTARDASDFVRSEWRRRAEVEYRSAAYAQAATTWLLLVGAPPVLIRAGLRIVADEIAHSELSYRVHRAAGGDEPPQVTRESMALPRAANEPLENDLTRVIAEVFCLGETIAVPLFHRLQRRCSVPVARRALDRVLRDEVRHRDFGWTVLEWLFALPTGAALRAQVDGELGAAFQRLRLAYTPRKGARDAFHESDRAWGLMSLSEYADALDATLSKMWVPRFRQLGIDAASKWAEELP
jgi:hypothetical protein